MRIAVISDVHGNAFALEAVLRDLKAQSPDLIVNLGDQVHGKANPRKAFELQQELGATEVLGSAEPLLIGNDPLAEWLKTQLSAESIQHLLNLPLTTTVLDGEILLCHGDLHSSSGHLLWSWQRGPYLTRGFQDLREHLCGVTARVILSGHTHREGMTAIDDHLVINAGAVSHQVDGDPRARWVLLEKQRGRWLTDFRRVNYDQKEAACWVLSHAPDPGEEAQLLMKGGH
ncbi:metallophosphoesterase family protein [Deinococcus cellulosilyticus]|uniref:Metallophosphoesterase n=1 Tax=Deinococcus cellulosilyticus (strain DSM 18568 / NBRC 106333 / KACC 11606 / 5516J-15) TaxID=1223518 RepID=A0A511N6F9_DEIC1|nr:metallophosphoesterase family protein [Deinococcus cellulosilyticus]GEM48433.1 metallophosphoesterase [Deinococcus cellulosilyticus NBRC 106333 = KACC 11606]